MIKNKVSLRYRQTNYLPRISSCKFGASVPLTPRNHLIEQAVTLSAAFIFLFTIEH